MDDDLLSERFSCSSFYKKTKKNDKVSKLIDRINKREEFIKSNPLHMPDTGILRSNDNTWKIFSKQSPALEYVAKSNRDVMAFSYESENLGFEGQRGFLVCNPKVLWKTQLHRHVSKRCIYEVIPQHKPCKIYLDLEFHKKENPNLDGSKMTDMIIDIINYFLNTKFNVMCKEENIVVLDSSSQNKFSRHVIFDSKESIFKNNFHVGRFISEIIQEIESSIKENRNFMPGYAVEELQLIYVKNSDQNSLFVDLSVYSKNRNFRTFRSCKLGKNIPLILINDQRYYSSENDETTFLASLLTYIPFKSDNFLQMSELEKENSYISSTRSTSYKPKSSFECQLKCPYPEVQKLIESIIGNGYIRSWRYYESETLVYEIARYRYCFNISREHKSNGIFYIVNLPKGVYYQKCHDPDCKDFQSNDFILPNNIKQCEYSDEFSSEDDILCLKAADEAEKSLTTLDPFEISDEDFLMAVNAIEHTDENCMK